MPTDEKPLMIRGDRFMLALNVLVWMLEVDLATKSRIKPLNLHGFRVISPGFPYGPGCSAVVYAFKAFIGTNQNLLAAAELDISLFLADLENVYDLDRAKYLSPSERQQSLQHIRELVMRIASGELTEADFRE